jgi:hypothetical protein
MTTLPPKSLRLAVLACCWAALSPLRAQTAPTETASESTTEAVPGALTDESLQAMLTNMGYTPKALSKGFLISFKRESSWTINMQLVLSPDHTKLGFNANLGKVEEASITAAQWVELLVANGDIDPSAFYFDRKQQKLYLHRSLDNRAVTPEFLRRQIETFAGQVTSTEKLWGFTK